MAVKKKMDRLLEKISNAKHVDRLGVYALEAMTTNDWRVLRVVAEELRDCEYLEIHNNRDSLAARAGCHVQNWSRSVKNLCDLGVVERQISQKGRLDKSSVVSFSKWAKWALSGPKKPGTDYIGILTKTYREVLAAADVPSVHITKKHNRAMTSIANQAVKNGHDIYDIAAFARGVDLSLHHDMRSKTDGVGGYPADAFWARVVGEYGLENKKI